ncbi:hypothetical protein E0K89_017050 [Aquicoccus sp. SCR17]|nr:hypothetical protein [Carideicomes alvinocaridis]
MPRSTWLPPAGALPLLVALCFGAAPLRAEPGDWSSAPDMAGLRETLDDWLDRNSAYPRRDADVRIMQVSRARALALAAPAARDPEGLRGLYQPEERTIYLIRPWSPREAQDVSVLLHELTHHRQQTARHWVCAGQQELPAYRLQEKWLAEQGETGSFNLIAAVIAEGCHPRDFHPGT